MKNVIAFLLLIAALLVARAGRAQVGIGTTTPDASAALEVRAANKGLLIPQVTLSALNDGTTIPTPATGLLVFNSNAGLSGGVGFYYNAGPPAAPSWTKLNTGAAAPGSNWSLTGNAATDSTANYLGTTDVKPIRLGINGQEQARLHTNGAFWLGGAPLGSPTFPDNQLLIGYQAGKKLPGTSFNNQFVGYQAGLKATGNYNQFIGFQAGLNTTTGAENYFSGMRAGLANTTGGQNFFVGFRAGEATTTASGNHFEGYLAGVGNTSGDQNTFVGRLAGTTTTFADNNTALGYNAGATVVSTTQNTLLGSGADITNVNIGNAIAIGYDAKVGRSSTMAFGNFNIQQWVFGRSTASSTNYALQVGDPSVTVNGNGAYLTTGGVWTNTSDRNLKENIQPVEGGQVLGLIRWTYKGTQGETHLGPMAQDFYRLFHLGLNDTSISTVDPAGVALVGVQELAKQNDQLRAENQQLRQQLQAVQANQTTPDARLTALEQAGWPAPIAPMAQASR